MFSACHVSWCWFDSHSAKEMVACSTWVASQPCLRDIYISTASPTSKEIFDQVPAPWIWIMSCFHFVMLGDAGLTATTEGMKPVASWHCPLRHYPHSLCCGRLHNLLHPVFWGRMLSWWIQLFTLADAGSIITAEIILLRCIRKDLLPDTAFETWTSPGLCCRQRQNRLVESAMRIDGSLLFSTCQVSRSGFDSHKGTNDPLACPTILISWQCPSDIDIFTISAAGDSIIG